MTKLLLLTPLALFALACSEQHANSCTVQCSTDDDCPGSQTCGDLGLCTGGEACSCTAGQFLGCADVGTARFCNATANGVEMQSCGAPGCNDTAGRCNACVPESVTCSADATSLDHCDADGLPAASDACTLGCIASFQSTPAHCGYIEPVFLPNVCDTAAAMPELAINGDTTIDTSTDATCTGGIVTQTMGPDICVIRYASISLNAGVVKVQGSRAVAFVADDALLVQSTLDVSADGSTSGPGGGTIASGGAATTTQGGGGAGFGGAGAAGGGVVQGGAENGGAALDPLVPPVRLVGGPTPPTYNGGLSDFYPVGGGGGGAVALISCRGTVSVSGMIDAGGGGGRGGRDTRIGTQTNYASGAGGGAGGHVALQGAEVRVTGGVFANGGAGGGGCTTDNCAGNPGEDAHPSTTAAVGGYAKDQGATGGDGAALTSPTGGYGSYTSPGGGGAGLGHMQTFTPEGGSVTTASSPWFEPNRNISIR